MNLKPGSKLNNGKYTIESRHGKGRFGVTYLAKDSEQHRVIIKTFYLDNMATTDPQRLKNNLLRESMSLKELDHPNIVKCVDAFLEKDETDDQVLYLVMEYVAGDNLEKRAEKILPEESAINYIHQIGEALKEVHAKGLVHRDVKPDNIVLKAGKSEVILVDFGLARNIGHNLSSANPESETSPGYTPIELYFDDEEKHPSGAYTDVYGLAATLYNLLTGEVPENADTIKSQIKGSQDPNPLSLGDVPNTNPIKNQWKIIKEPIKLNPNITKKTNIAIKEGMALEPGDRPQTMQEWLDLLPPSTIPSPIPNGDDHLKLAQANLRWVKISLVVAAAIGIIGLAIGIIGALPGWIQMMGTPKDQPSPPITSPSP